VTEAAGARMVGAGRSLTGRMLPVCSVGTES